jgi:hypothetical protein
MDEERIATDGAKRSDRTVHSTDEALTGALVE